jgi:hypothetical protein
MAGDLCWLDLLAGSGGFDHLCYGGAGEIMSGYRIKDWNKFQHYQDGKRKPEWIKLYRNLLDDVEWFELDPKDSKVLIMLWMLASENGGTLPPIKKIAFRLRLSEKEIKSILSRLPHWLEQDASGVLADCYQSDSPEEEGEEEENKKEKERERRASALPAHWGPSESHFLQGEKLGFSAAEIQDMAEDMRLWAGAKGEVKKNWDMAFSGWMRREKKSNRGGAPPLSRTEIASRKIAQEIASGTFGGLGIRDEHSSVSARLLPKPSARPGDSPEAAYHPMHGAAEGAFEPDG